MADEAAAPEPGAGSTGLAESLLQSGAADEPEDASAAGERCRAMMEVVATDGAGGKSKWKVSKLVVEHSHELRVALGEVAVTVSTLGMEFDSVEDGKEFYYGYGERVGFKAGMGSNRRSVEDDEKIAQRFLCWRGNCSNLMSKGKDSDEGKELEELVEEAANASAAGKRKRQPYKRSRKPVTKSTEVIEVDKGVGMAGAGNGRGSRGGRNKKCLVEKDGEPVDIEVAHNGTADDEDDEEEGGEDGVHQEVRVVKEKRGRGRLKKVATEDDALQAHVLRELGLRVLQYDNEERKKILSKYLSKRQNRPTQAGLRR